MTARRRRGCATGSFRCPHCADCIDLDGWGDPVAAHLTACPDYTGASAFDLDAALAAIGAAFDHTT